MGAVWVRISESTNAAVLREAEPIRDEGTESLDIPGIYVNTSGTSYKVTWTAIERDTRGHVLRRQRTRNFPRRAKYPPVTLPAFGRIKSPTALLAAWAFKLKMDAAARAGRTERTEEPTVADLFDAFMSSKDRRPTTEAYYRGVYRKHIAPTFGAWLVEHVDVTAVERWYADLEARPAAKRAAAQTLRAVFGYAVRRGTAPSDPTRVLVVGQNTVRALAPDDVLTAAQVSKLAQEVGPRYRALVLLLAYGGVRIGEAVALRIDRIDFKRRQVTIDASATEVGGKLLIGPPKTRSSVRSFTAPVFLVDSLAEHIEWYPSDAGLVFTGERGAPIRPGNFRRRVFDPAAKRAGLPGLHVHDLRHVCASTLAAHGASPTEIAHRLGHSSASTTQRVYLHMMAARDEALAGMQDEAYALTQADVLRPPEPQNPLGGIPGPGAVAPTP